MSNAVVSLTIETVKAGHGVLVFCSGRQVCQSTATLISEAMPPVEALEAQVLDRRKDVISELRTLPVGLDDTLGFTILRGVAFHRLFS